MGEPQYVSAQAGAAVEECKNSSPVPKLVEEETENDSPSFSLPTYTMKNIHDAIPPHCFKRFSLLSLSYIIRDFLFVFTLATVATQIERLPSYYLRAISWNVYAFLQGIIFTGLWELAHECGHQALSPSKTFNDTAGLIIHSFLLVPYHSWRFTHAHHHKATNNLERDIAFVPATKDAWIAERETPLQKALLNYWDLVEDMPIVNLLILVGHQLIAWPSMSDMKRIQPLPNYLY